MQYVYMASPSYSGSTMLSIILGTHPIIATVGEIKGISHRGDYRTFKTSSGSLMVESPFWISMEKAMQSLQLDFSLKNFNTHLYYPAHTRKGRLINILYYQLLKNYRLDQWKEGSMSRLFPSRDEHIRRAVKNTYFFAKTLCEKEGSSIFLDASKDAIALKYLKKYMNPSVDFKLIHLVRDGRAVANSFLKKEKIKEMAVAARYWKKTHEKIEVLKNHYFKQENCITVLYEEFCREPKRELEKISDFLGINLNFRVENIHNSEHHIIGNSMRLKPISHIRSDSQWEERLSEEQKATFQRIAGAMNQRYGF